MKVHYKRTLNLCTTTCFTSAITKYFDGGENMKLRVPEEFNTDGINVDIVSSAYKYWITQPNRSDNTV